MGWFDLDNIGHRAFKVPTNWEESGVCYRREWEQTGKKHRRSTVHNPKKQKGHPLSQNALWYRFVPGLRLLSGSVDSVQFVQVLQVRQIDTRELLDRSGNTAFEGGIFGRVLSQVRLVFYGKVIDS